MTQPVSLLDLGFSEDPAFDNTPAWNAAVATGGPNWLLTDGLFTFKTPPNPIARPMRLDGVNINKSSFFRDYNPIGDTPLLHATATVCIQNISFAAKSGSGGRAVQFDGLAASASILRDSYLTGQGGVWQVPLLLTSSDPLGIRGCAIEHVELFAATAHLFWGINVQGLTMLDVNCYPAGGTSHDTVIQNSGSYRSAAIHWVSRYLETLYLYNTDNVTIANIAPVTINQTGCTNVRQL